MVSGVGRKPRRGRCSGECSGQPARPVDRAPRHSLGGSAPHARSLRRCWGGSSVEPLLSAVAARPSTELERALDELSRAVWSHQSGPQATAVPPGPSGTSCCATRPTNAWSRPRGSAPTKWCHACCATASPRRFSNGRSFWLCTSSGPSSRTTRSPIGAWPANGRWRIGPKSRPRNISRARSSCCRGYRTRRGAAERQLDLELSLGRTVASFEGYASGRTQAIFARAHGCCETLGNLPRLFSAINGLWAYHMLRGDASADARIRRTAV